MTDTVVSNIMSGLSPRFHIRVHIDLDPVQNLQNDSEKRDGWFELSFMQMNSSSHDRLL